LSEIRATTISDAAGTGPITLTKQSAAKGWWVLSDAAVPQNSFNVSSGTDNGTGDYSANLTSAMSTSDSSTYLNSLRNLKADISGGDGTSMRNTSTVKINCVQTNSTSQDIESSGGINGDLA
jgi:hypothetical protein